MQVRAHQSADPGVRRRPGARGVWLPQLDRQHEVQQQHRSPNSFLSGARPRTLTSAARSRHDRASSSSSSRARRSRVGWDAARRTSNNTFSSFNPQLSSTFSFNLMQPLWRGFKIDVNRAQFKIVQEEPGDHRRPAAAADRRHGARRPPRLLDPRRNALQPGRRPGLARHLAPDAARQPDPRRGRHHGADRHRRRRGRSGPQRGSGDHRGVADRRGSRTSCAR